MLETFQPVVGGLDAAPKTTLLKARYGVGAMPSFDTQETLSLPPYHLMHIRPPEGHGTKRLGNPMSTDMRGETV